VLQSCKTWSLPPPVDVRGLSTLAMLAAFASIVGGKDAEKHGKDHAAEHHLQGPGTGLAASQRARVKSNSL